MRDESWTVLSRQPVLEHPQLQVAMEQVCLPNGKIIPDWPVVNASHYSNAVVVNEAGEILIHEGYRHGARRHSWQMVGAYLERAEEDPLCSIQRALGEVGYTSNDWRYLGSYVVDGDQHVSVAYFFLAMNVRKAQLESDFIAAPEWRWVSRADLETALLDGRINLLNYATNLMLAFQALERRTRQAEIDRLLRCKDS
jgi:8-oxo-dGTP pyrophosphatase MutT (NUDIX family)